MNWGLLTPLLVNTVTICRSLFIHTLESLYIDMFTCSLFVFLYLKLNVIHWKCTAKSSQSKTLCVYLPVVHQIIENICGKMSSELSESILMHSQRHKSEQAYNSLSVIHTKFTIIVYKYLFFQNLSQHSTCCCGPKPTYYMA